jgi:hypothetical protein
MRQPLLKSLYFAEKFRIETQGQERSVDVLGHDF